jgi:hypothetical protein
VRVLGGRTYHTAELGEHRLRLDALRAHLVTRGGRGGANILERRRTVEVANEHVK